MKSVLMVSGSGSDFEVIRDCLSPGYSVDFVSGEGFMAEGFPRRDYELFFLDISFLSSTSGSPERVDYMKGLQRFWHRFPSAHIIVLAGQESIREAVKAVKFGASDYITYPVNPAEVRHVTESVLESMRMRSELDYLRERFWRSDSMEVVRTRSPLMEKVFEKVRSVSPTRSTVLLMGETGVGKGVISRLIHQHSNRAGRQFISVHCGAIPDTLLESELFGHEKGAFTGAIRKKPGKFEIARGGTIFLDEISTLTPIAQVKLLQVLQEKSFSRVGGEESIDADVRIIAASNVDIKRLCEEGRFRSDLYYRLNVFPVDIPPLRDRLEDLPLLVDSMLKKLNRFHSKGIRRVHPGVMSALKGYSWPGNIRELENLIERAYILETGSELTAGGFPAELFSSGADGEKLDIDLSLTIADARRRGVEQIEKEYIKRLMAEHGGRVNLSAKAAGIGVRQLHKLMVKYGIEKKLYKSRPLVSVSESGVPVLVKQEL